MYVMYMGPKLHNKLPQGVKHDHNKLPQGVKHETL